MERRFVERTRTWRVNLSNVFEGIRPLVEANSSNQANMLRSWMQNRPNRVEQAQLSTASHPVALPTTSPQQVNNNLRDSFVINFDAHPSSSYGRSTSQFPARLSSQPNLTTNSGDPGTDVVRMDRLSYDGGASSHADVSTNHQHHFNDLHHHQHSHHHSGHLAAAGEPNDTNLRDNAATNNGEPDGGLLSDENQHPEARALLNTLLRYVPFICILFVKSCYDHLDGILNIFALIVTFMHANWVVRQEITKQAQRSVLLLLRELLYIVLVIAIIGFVLEKNSIFISLIFANTFTEPFTLQNLLFSVLITDLVLKLITVGVKILITLMPTSVIEYKGRGRIYLVTEATSQLYRALAPIQPWIVFLLDSYSGKEKLLGVALSAAYMVAKGVDLMQRLTFLKLAFIELLKKVSFGSNPTKKQIQTAGGQCPICHDSYTSPVMLKCNHIFCEMCVGTWFDREQTCPLCRAKVADDPSWRDGATTGFVQLY